MALEYELKYNPEIRIHFTQRALIISDQEIENINEPIALPETIKRFPQKLLALVQYENTSRLTKALSQFRYLD